MSFDNIPAEMRAYKQWICWRLEWKESDTNHTDKPTKVPYSPWPGGFKASVTKPEHWGTFEQACAAPITCMEPVEHSKPIGETGLSGIGFVFTLDDPFCGIDLDDTHEDQEAHAKQLDIFHRFETYSEYSPSGKGCHIIAKGVIPHGRRRGPIELYANERYFTMTGKSIRDLPIADCQLSIDILFNMLGGKAKQEIVVEETEQFEEDDAIVAAASAAVNGDKFSALYEGNWQSLYSSQSEADFALIDIIAFYTKNKAQIARIFRQSMLGQRDKAKRDDYVNYMVEKAFDRQIPPVDNEAFMVEFRNALEASKGGATAGEPGGSTAAAPTNGTDTAGAGISHSKETGVNPFPPGLLGEVAQFIYNSAPRPVHEIALAGAIGFLAGITGRAYNISNAGLNQYILVLAPTGVGKDAISDGVSALMSSVQLSVPSVIDFKGPGQLVSSAGIIRWLEKRPCVVSILGEFGKKMKAMAAPNANSHLQGLSGTLLEMFSKSGAKGVFDPTAYSDVQKNTVPLLRPSLSIIGESVPSEFYDVLDESLIADGLLPRFMIFEYKGDRAYFNKNAINAIPGFDLIQRLSDLVSYSLSVQNKGTVHEVEMTAEAHAKFDEFDKWTTDQINQSKSEVHKQLWNRAHLKAMKLAAIQAVGENWLNPQIGITGTLWATGMIVAQTQQLIAKFETGMIGQVGGSESRQLNDVMKVVASYFKNPHDKFAKYGGSFEMHRGGVITEAHISRRCSCMSSFRNDRLGPTAALKRTIKTLLDADELREIPPKQMVELFGSKPRAFSVSNASRFIEADIEN
jgi:hypothetical protein